MLSPQNASTNGNLQEFNNVLPLIFVYNRRKKCYNIKSFEKEVTQWVAIFAESLKPFAEVIWFFSLCVWH